MSNIENRNQIRKSMREIFDVGGQACFGFELQIAVMQTEILDEYLKEKIRSDKVIEGLLGDIRSGIERASERCETVWDE